MKGEGFCDTAGGGFLEVVDRKKISLLFLTAPYSFFVSSFSALG